MKKKARTRSALDIDGDDYDDDQQSQDFETNRLVSHDWWKLIDLPSFHRNLMKDASNTGQFSILIDIDLIHVRVS